MSQKEFNALFEYFEGYLFWKKTNFYRIKVGDLVGCDNGAGYLTTKISGKCYKIHRIIWIMHYGQIPEGIMIDHINGIKDDNRIENLRLATHGQNRRNSRKDIDSENNLKGVYLTKYGTYQSRIFINGKTKYLGTFNTKEDAHLAYCFVAKEIFGEFFNNGEAHG